MFRRAALSLCQFILSHCDAELVRTPRLMASRRARTRSHEDAELFQRARADYSRNRTRGDFVGFLMLFTQARRVIRDGIEGDCAEVGVYKDLTAKVLLRCCDGRALHLFDRFEGHPPNADRQRDGAEYVRFVAKDPMADTSLESVRTC